MKKSILALSLVFVMCLSSSVSAKESKKSAKLNLSKHSVVLTQKGNTASIDATILEGNNVIKDSFGKIKFTSSNENVAFEAYGFIYATGKGKATITAEYNNVKDSIEVEVQSDEDLNNLPNVSILQNQVSTASSLPTLSSKQISYMLNKA